MSYLNIAKRVLAEIGGSGSALSTIHSADHTIKPEVSNPSRRSILVPFPTPVQARIRGTDRVQATYNAEICWHCRGVGSCRCACCGQGTPMDWKQGQCGACRGTGFLCWGKVN